MTYYYTDSTNKRITRNNGDGSNTTFPTDPANRDYAEFLSSGAIAEDYFAPPEHTTEEKVNSLLSAYGLTRDELRAALEA